MNRLHCVRASTCGKLVLFGEHAVVYGFPSVVASVDARLTVTVSRSLLGHDVFSFCPAADQSFFVRTLRLVRETFSFSLPIHVCVSSSISGYGLGASAALAVCLVGAVGRFSGARLSRRDIFSHACRIIRTQEPYSSGCDVASCVWGRTVVFDGKTHSITRVFSRRLPIVVGFTGSKARTQDVLSSVLRQKRDHPERIGELLSRIGGYAARGSSAIEARDWHSVGDLMHATHHALRELGVSSHSLDRLCVAATRAGAWGAKLSGAGKGDCMIAVSPRTTRSSVVRAIRQAGGIVLPLRLGDSGGVRVSPCSRS